MSKLSDAYTKAVARYPGFTLPAPLHRCTRCEKHAAVYRGEGTDEWLCGPCGPRVSVFRLPMKANDLRQLAADAALEVKEGDARPV